MSSAHDKSDAQLLSQSRILRIALYLLSVICAVLLFVGTGPDYYSPRPYRLAWELGHVCTFFIWTLAAFLALKAFARTPFSRQLILALLATSAGGLLIEWLQSMVGRTFALTDVMNDLLGTVIAIAFLSPTRHLTKRRTLRILQSASLVLLILQLLPLAKVVIDDIIAWQQFPILADFETPFEAGRWVSESPTALSDQIFRHGRFSLQVRLKPAQYSGASLRYFPSDWRNYSTLHLSIFNVSKEALPITISIHDIQHIRTGQAYADRFTANVTLSHGWNNIDLPLTAVQHAPGGRNLDMSEIRDISIVTVGMWRPHVIYIDNVRLIDPN
jgi:VanZ family protein